MKTAKSKFRNVLMSAALLFAISASFAQATTTKKIANKLGADPNYDQGFRLGFGLSGGYILETDLYAGPVVGGDVRLQYDMSKRTSITLTTGYTHIFVDGDVKDNPFIDINDTGIIPIKAGFKGFFWEDQFYAIGEAGVGLTISANRPEGENTNVIIAPGIGWATKYVDLSVRYEHYTEYETGQIALRLAYGFRL